LFCGLNQFLHYFHNTDSLRPQSVFLHCFNNTYSLRKATRNTVIASSHPRTTDFTGHEWRWRNRHVLVLLGLWAASPSYVHLLTYTK
jgi:hypothetical protein